MNFTKLVTHCSASVPGLAGLGVPAIGMFDVDAASSMPFDFGNGHASRRYAPVDKRYDCDRARLDRWAGLLTIAITDYTITVDEDLEVLPRKSIRRVHTEQGRSWYGGPVAL